MSVAPKKAAPSKAAPASLPVPPYPRAVHPIAGDDHAAGASGGIDDNRITVARFSSLDGIESDRSRITFGCPFHNVNFNSVSPNFQLFDRSSAKSVGSSHQDLFTILGQEIG